ncbi:MAG TPA: DUF3558 family protein [Actinophytocola sp.]|uniref:DUF3558 family protein n=1 Tax=Actinophytocola sp. TaxID=1872138 RepID=UPI002E008E26|nr:DUF3558 family protein [Actinophytocola sp.]
MPRRLLALPLALVLTACGSSEPPFGSGGRVDPPMTPSHRTSTEHATATSRLGTAAANPRAYLESKPCELLSADEATSLGLNARGKPGKDDNGGLGLSCYWSGRDFATLITIASRHPVAKFERMFPGGRKTTIAGRRPAYVASGAYSGGCDVVLDVNGTSALDIVITRHDKNEVAACVVGIKLGTLMHPRLPGA